MLAAAGLLLLLGVIGFSHGGPVAADESEHVRLTAFLGPLTVDRPVRQPFTARGDGLSTLTTQFGTAGGLSQCAVVATLLDGDRSIAEQTIPCGTIPESSPIEVLSFAPISGSDGHHYELNLKLAAPTDERPTVWAGVDEGGRLPPATMGTDPAPVLAPEIVGTDPVPISVDLHTFYGDDEHAWSQIGTALRRMTQGRPPWQTPVTVVLLALGSLAALIALVVVRGRAALALIVVLALLKGVLWSVVLPPLEGPDEVAHVAYAQFLAEAHRIPKRDVWQLGLPRDIIYSEQLTTSVRVLHQEAATPGDHPDYGPTVDLSAQLGGLSPDANGDGAATGYPPHYYVPAALLYAIAPGRLDQKIEYMRLWSVALGAVAAAATLLLGRRLFPRREGAAIALAVAFTAQPMLSQQTAVVNGDALELAASALCLLGCVVLARPHQEQHRWLPFLTAAAAGVAILAKLFGVALLPVIAAAWLVGRARTEPAQRRTLVRDAVQLVLGLGVTYGSWFLFAAAFGFKGAKVSDLPEGTGPTSLSDFFELLSRQRFQSARGTWVEGLWGHFSWLNTRLPAWTRTMILLALIAGALVVISALVRLMCDLRPRRASWRDDEVVHFGLVMLTALSTAVVLYAVTYVTFKHTARLELLQGRYALLALPAILALPVLGLGRLAPRLSQVIPMVVIAAAMVVLNAIGLAVVAEHFYL